MSSILEHLNKLKQKTGLNTENSGDNFTSISSGLFFQKKLETNNELRCRNNPFECSSCGLLPRTYDYLSCKKCFKIICVSCGDQLRECPGNCYAGMQFNSIPIYLSDFVRPYDFDTICNVLSLFEAYFSLICGFAVRILEDTNKKKIEYESGVLLYKTLETIIAPYAYTLRIEAVECNSFRAMIHFRNGCKRRIVPCDLELEPQIIFLHLMGILDEFYEIFSVKYLVYPRKTSMELLEVINSVYFN